MMREFPFLFSRDWLFLFVRVAFSILVPPANICASFQVSAKDDTGY